MPSVAGDHSHVPVGQSVQRDVTAPRPRHGGMSVEDPRLSGSTHRAVAALLPPGNVVARDRRRRRRRLHRACSGRRRGQTGFFQLLRACDRARVGDGDDDGGNPQYYDVRGSAARTAARPVHVQLARDQRADRWTNDAENPRTIHRQLPRLLTTSAVVPWLQLRFDGRSTAYRRSLRSQCRCASRSVVECRICNREVAGLNLGLGYFAPRSTQPFIPPGLVNEYQL